MCINLETCSWLWLGIYISWVESSVSKNPSELRALPPLCFWVDMQFLVSGVGNMGEEVGGAGAKRCISATNNYISYKKNCNLLDITELHNSDRNYQSGPSPIDQFTWITYNSFIECLYWFYIDRFYNCVFRELLLEVTLIGKLGFSR